MSPKQVDATRYGLGVLQGSSVTIFIRFYERDRKSKESLREEAANQNTSFLFY
jgi:hypothetical protein